METMRIPPFLLERYFARHEFSAPYPLGSSDCESMELGELLASFGRKKDALDLLRSVSEESEQKGNTELHLRTARLAKELKDEVTVRAACMRALSTGQAGLKCP